MTICCRAVSLEETSPLAPKKISYWDSNLLRITLIVVGILFIVAPFFMQGVNEFYEIIACGILLVAAGVAGFIEKHHHNQKIKKDQDTLIEKLHLDPEELPTDLSKRAGAIDEAQKKRADQIYGMLDEQIASLEKSIQEFKTIRDSNIAPKGLDVLEPSTRQEKLDLYWAHLKTTYRFHKTESLCKGLRYSQRHEIEKKQTLICGLKRELGDARLKDYRDLLPEGKVVLQQVLQKDAKKYYLESFPEGKRSAMRARFKERLSTGLNPQDKVVKLIKILEERISKKGFDHWDVVELNLIKSELETFV